MSARPNLLGIGGRRALRNVLEHDGDPFLRQQEGPRGVTENSLP